MNLDKITSHGFFLIQPYIIYAIDEVINDVIKKY